MKSKFIKFLISGLLIILSITSIFTYNSYKNKQIKTQQVLNNQTQVEQTFRVIDKNVLIQTLNKENSINVLSGSVNVQAKYSDKNISDDDNSMKWIKDYFADITSKDLTVDYTYNYMFSFDLTNLPIRITNNEVQIQISLNRLSLSKCELSQADSKDRIGLLTSKFSSQQINALNQRSRDLAFNRIQSDEDLRTKCFEQLKDNIKDLIKPLVHNDTSIVFSDCGFDVVQQSEATITK